MIVLNVFATVLVHTHISTSSYNQPTHTRIFRSKERPWKTAPVCVLSWTEVLSHSPHPTLGIGVGRGHVSQQEQLVEAYQQLLQE